MKITEELRGPVVQTINENEKVGKGQKQLRLVAISWYGFILKCVSL